MADVVIERLTKCYRRGAFALRECTLHIPNQRCTVVIGPSGCGKTTLLRLIAGLETPDAGIIRIGDRVVNALSPHERNVAMVFQDFALYPHMRLGKNLAFAASLRGVSRDEIARRVDQAAKMLGISQLLDRMPGELSGGERQRAALARVLVRQPACALYDEPLSNLDASLRTQLRGELKLLQGRVPTTSIFVTHDQEEAMSLADHLVVMADGVVQQSEPPLEVYRKPANRFVAGFIGSPAMNFIEGTIDAVDGAPMFRHRTDIAIAVDHTRAELVGRHVVLGVRPHALSPDGEGPGIAARVSLVEPLGPFNNVRCETSGGVSLMTRLDARVRVGDTLSLQFHPSELHFFEPGDFGKAL